MSLTQQTSASAASARLSGQSSALKIEQGGEHKSIGSIDVDSVREEPALDAFLSLVTSINYVVVALFVLIAVSCSQSLDLLKMFAVFFELPLIIFILFAKYVRERI